MPARDIFSFAQEQRIRESLEVFKARLDGALGSLVWY